MPGLTRGAADTLAALVNFNHAQRLPEEVRSFTHKVLNTLDARPSSAGTAHCYAVASTVLRVTVTDFSTIQNLLGRFDLKFPAEAISQDETLATACIGLAVAAMYGFKSETDYSIAHTRAKTALDLCNKFPSGKNVENSTLSISQLLRYQGKFSSTAEKMEILDLVIQQALRYGSQHPEIVATIVRELSSRYGSSDTDPLVRDRLYQIAMDLIQGFRSTPLAVSVFPGEFFADDLIAAVDSNDYDRLRHIANDIAELQKIPYVDLSHLYPKVTQEFLRQWNTACNGNEISAITEVATMSQYWLDTLPDTTSMAPILNYIVCEFGNMHGN
jgi:hypothetical protein